MYHTLSKGTTKFVTKTLSRGYTQPLERLERDRKDLDNRREPLSQSEMNVPKPVFNSRKKYASNPTMNNSRISQETISSQHEEIVRYVHEGWQKVQYEYDLSTRQGKEGKIGGPIYYQEKVAAPMRDFEPFDIDKWAMKRTVQKLPVSS